MALQIFPTLTVTWLNVYVTVHLGSVRHFERVDIFSHKFIRRSDGCRERA